MRIMVAMSGGIDSSVVAHLLAEQGHELIGVMMKIWTDASAPDMRKVLPQKCCSIEHIARAREVCKTLDIPFYVINLEQEFKDHVVDPFLQGYAEGITPNPCIECNRLIKFGKLIEQADALDCDQLATGHYAQISLDEETQAFRLLEAVDSQKDQSYFLYSLTQDKLARCLFPLGDKTKTEVFSLAKDFKVPLPPTYRESQDLCFYPEKTPTAFLERHLPKQKPGPIREENGEEIGQHKGLPFYTIGQRKGLQIGGRKIPLHVTRKDTASNTIFVAEAGKDTQSVVTTKQIHWVNPKYKTTESKNFSAKLHSLGTKHQGTLQCNDSAASFTLQSPIRGVAAGQSMVLYNHNEIVGGAEITTAE